MKLSRRFVISSILGATAFGSAFAQAPPAAAGGSGGRGRGPAGPGLTLTSPAFEDGGIIPNKFTQADPNPVSPKLEWSNVPATAVAFVLIMHDPDTAPQRSPKTFCTGWSSTFPALPENYPKACRTTPVGRCSLQPKALNGKNGFMGPGAGAAGPYHHYTLELYALDTKLDVTADTPRADVIKAMDGHVVAKAALVGRFHR